MLAATVTIVLGTWHKFLLRAPFPSFFKSSTFRRTILPNGKVVTRSSVKTLLPFESLQASSFPDDRGKVRMGGARCGLALWGLRSQSTAQEGARSARHTRRRRRRVPPGERAVTAPSRSVPGGARGPGTGRLAARPRGVSSGSRKGRREEPAMTRGADAAPGRRGPRGVPAPSPAPAANRFQPLPAVRLPAATLPFSARPWSLQNFESFVMVSPLHLSNWTKIKKKKNRTKPNDETNRCRLTQ